MASIDTEPALEKALGPACDRLIWASPHLTQSGRSLRPRVAMQSGHGRGPQDQRLLPMAVADRCRWPLPILAADRCRWPLPIVADGRCRSLPIVAWWRSRWAQAMLALPRASHAARSPASRAAKRACTRNEEAMKTERVQAPGDEPP